MRKLTNGTHSSVSNWNKKFLDFWLELIKKESHFSYWKLNRCVAALNANSILIIFFIHRNRRSFKTCRLNTFFKQTLISHNKTFYARLVWQTILPTLVPTHVNTLKHFHVSSAKYFKIRYEFMLQTHWKHMFFWFKPFFVIIPRPPSDIFQYSM